MVIHVPAFDNLHHEEEEEEEEEDKKETLHYHQVDAHTDT